MERTKIDEIIDEAIEFFDEGNIKKGAELLLKAYNESEDKLKTLSYFDEIFFKPNIKEMERIYQLNSDKVNVILGFIAPEFKNLPYMVIPIEEDLFYLYSKDKAEIISEGFNSIQKAVIKLCTNEDVHIETDNDISEFLQSIYNKESNEEVVCRFNSSKLHVGCGRNIMEGWINLDIADLPGVDIVADLDNCKNVKLPLGNDSIDEFFVSHVIEHIKNPLEMMEELHRVASPGAVAVFRCPYGSSDEAFEDPTHVRQYFLNSFGYFSQPFYWRADYGYRGDWITEKITLVVDGNKYKGKTPQQILDDVNRYRNVVIEMVAELRAVKPIRDPKKELQVPTKIEIRMNN